MTDITVERATLYFLPIEVRVPYHFGAEVLTSVTCARVRLDVRSAGGIRASGWGETPLSIGWMWPTRTLEHGSRLAAVESFCLNLAEVWSSCSQQGHPMEIGDYVNTVELPLLMDEAALRRPRLPRLAALVCNSAFDLALHDAFGVAHQVPTYETYTADYMNRDLGAYLHPAEGSEVSFEGLYPVDFLTLPPRRRLPAWHSVGLGDPLVPSELSGGEPRDGYPVLLADWILRDGLVCLKVKLSGVDWDRDFRRLCDVGAIARAHGAKWLCADFNCTVSRVEYVTSMLDRLLETEPLTYQMLLYVEQPFAPELEEARHDVRAIAARKPLYLDESAHDWRQVALGRERGWTGVALKTCKTQTGALLSLCWAKAHGMTVMVQDLTNPMLAQISHALLAAHAGTVMGLETNATQFYPDASAPEAAVHPAVYRRSNGVIDVSSLTGSGFGYDIERMDRRLPAPAYAG